LDVLTPMEEEAADFTNDLFKLFIINISYWTAKGSFYRVFLKQLNDFRTCVN
jgi:hypothetical protein